ncbi:MAG: hypothetical protein IJJ85_11435 [Clostridia bacterium]|nr:hypothetical protein [Clostridia bacterium]
MKNFNPWYMLVSILSAVTLLMGNLGLLEKQEEKTRFIAHRGFSSQYLENTEEAFIKAAEVGFDGCETDVKITSDGVLVLAHSGSYEYADGTSRAVEESTFAELTEKPLKNDFTDTVLYPCTFRRYIEIMRDYHMFAFIELKGEYPEESLRDMVETVEELYTWDMCSVQSMRMENLLQLRELYPQVPLMFCGGGYSADVGKALQYGFDCDLLIPDIFPVVLRAFQLKGLRTAVWTANDKKAVSWALWLGVDFIESDYLWGLNAA